MDVINGNVLKKMLKDADEGGYAIPMFNYTDVWDQMAVIEAAWELRAPVMFASIPKTVDAFTVQLLGCIGLNYMERSETLLIHHLDHSNSVELCKNAIDAGYPSVMIDASKESLENNIKMVGQVVSYAHEKNVCVEGEIGRIKGRDYEAVFEGEDFLVKVEDAVALAEATGVDTLAVGIGTAHGFYKGKPELNFTRLEEVNEAVSIPLVLHGGTGIPKEDIRKAIRCGINKVNIGTQIRYTYMEHAARTIEEKGPASHTVDIMKEVKKYVRETAKEWIRICMADGKA